MSEIQRLFIMELKEIEAKLKDPNEHFRFNGQSFDFRIVDFWAWNQSDLVENRNRGILAEFIVRQAIGIEQPTRLEWDAYDLKTKDEVKIEIKSAAYIQAWSQRNYSSIAFDIKPTKTLLDDNNYSDNKSRHADIYIFCLLHHKEQKTVNPMNLDQWTFYLVATETLNKEFPEQQTISLSTIERIPNEKCTYMEIKERFEKLKKEVLSHPYIKL